MAGTGDPVNNVDDAETGCSSSVELYSGAYLVIAKDITHRFIRDFETWPPTEQKKAMTSVGKAVVTCTLEPALKAGDPTVAPLAAIVKERRKELSDDLGRLAGYEARQRDEFHGHTFTLMKQQQAKANRCSYARRIAAASRVGPFAGSIPGTPPFNTPASLLPLAHGADSLFTVDGAQPSILMTADLPIRDGPRLSSAVENGQGANKKKTTAAEEEEQSVSSRGKRSRDGVAAARGGATVERGGGGGTSDDKEEREGGGEGEDDDVDELASSVASCSVSGRDKKVRVTGSVSRQEERSLMARFRTVATNAFTDAEAGSETERLWGAAANAAREEGTEPYTKLLDFLGGYRGCPANMSTEDEKLRMLKYLGKLRFGLPA